MVARPVVWGAVATIALLALAAPALGLRLGEPAVDAPKGASVITTMDAIQRAFPQAPAPAEVVVTGADVSGPKVLAAVDQLRADAAAGRLRLVHQADHLAARLTGWRIDIRSDAAAIAAEPAVGPASADRPAPAEAVPAEAAAGAPAEAASGAGVAADDGAEAASSSSS